MSYGPDIDRSVPAGGRLRRSHSQGREASRSAGQAPTKFELVINLKTAKALGLDRAANAARPRRRGDRMRRARVHQRCSAARRRGRSRRVRSSERMRRVGVLTNLASDDPEAQARIGAFVQGLAAIWLGRSDVICGSTTVGAGAMPTEPADMQQNWSRSRRTSFSTSGSTAVGTVAASDPERANCVRAGTRSRWLGLRQKYGASGRQCYRFQSRSNTA